MRATRPMTAAESLELQLKIDDMKAAKRKSSDPRKSIERAESEVIESKLDPVFWREKARPAHFVALYQWLHRNLYGVDPAEFQQSKTVLAAMASAKKFIEKNFAGDGYQYIDFIRWVFRQEKRELEKGKKNGFLITWRFVFTPTTTLTKYRVEVMDRGRRML